MTIYIVILGWIEDGRVVGYFDDLEQAKACGEYYKRTEGERYYIEEYELNNTDYLSLIKELNEKKKAVVESKQEALKQRELAELARLKAKYEQ